MRLAREAQQTKWEEDARQRQIAEERKQREEVKVKELRYMVARWDESQKIIAFLADIAERGEKIGKVVGPEWLNWARDYANRLDPIRILES